MTHAMVYHGKFELNHKRLSPSTHTMILQNGRSGPLPVTTADGIHFGYMTRGSSDFLVVKAGRVVLGSPVRLDFDRHTDGKGVAPSPTTFGDESARRLLRDIMRANPSQTDEIVSIFEYEGFGFLLGKLRPRMRGTDQPAVNDDSNEGELPDVDLGATLVDGPEGAAVLRQHLVRERNRGLVEKKRREVKAREGRLACEACGFDFGRAYPGLGDEYCEVHHLSPLGQSEGTRRTSLAELAIVCSNCHRMIHRRPQPLTLDELRQVVARAT